MSELQPGTAAHLALGKMQEALAGPACARATSSRGEGLEQTHISFPNTSDVPGQAEVVPPAPALGQGTGSRVGSG